MTCNLLGFDDCGTLRVNKSADTSETFVLPSDFDTTDWTGSFQIRASEGAASSLLTITESPNSNGSALFFGGRYITVRIEKEDLATLPNATDTDDPWEGVYQLVVTDTFDLTSQLCAGALIAEKGVVR